MSSFELQGHRGARGYRPENTLAAFEAALDLGVAAIETDVHLTADGEPVLCHEPVIDDRLCRLERPGAPPPASRPMIAQLTMEQFRCYSAGVNPDPARFPRQQTGPAPLAELLAKRWGRVRHHLPSVAELFSFVQAYTAEEGRQMGKSDAQRQQAGRVIFDLEIKRVPFHPEWVPDGFTGRAAGRLEMRLLQEIANAGVLERTRVRSFDHRCLAAIKELEPGISLAVLIANTAPASPGELARAAGADLYCPDFRFVDEDLIRRAHGNGVRVIPWTVNEVEMARKLLEWGVDGITTDYPDLLTAADYARATQVLHEPEA